MVLLDFSEKFCIATRTTDTYARSYDDYPTSETYGAVNPIYEEDIYVGYRYFETFAQARDSVLYPFGYGLSYTDFTKQLVGFSATDDQVTVSVKVTNTGDRAGKDVVQVYYSAPEDKMDKAAIELAAYAKTDELGPLQSQVLTLTFATEDMASYDDAGKTGLKSAWVMEPGQYEIYFGSHVRDLEHAGTYDLGGLRLVEQLTEQLSVEEQSVFNRLKSDGTYEAVPTRTVPLSAIEYDIPEEIEIVGDQGIKLVDVYNGDATMEEFVAQLTLEDLEFITEGGGMDVEGIDIAGMVMEYISGWPTFIQSIVRGVINVILNYVSNLPEEFAVAATGGYGNMPQYGVPAVSVVDGPAGIRVGEASTQFPMAMALASTWNQELMERVGWMIGQEAIAHGMDVWLAPALNIHRDPLLGRSFEYYSEDPLVSGITAAAVTRGVQSVGVGVTLKHFAANNQENYRQSGSSIVSERALREIYLKGFEIAVKTADPWYIMSSYNMVNGSYASSNYELQTNVLRKEWNWAGTVMTDWMGSEDDGTASMVRAQNDLLMPGNLSVNIPLVPTITLSGSDLDLTADVAAGKVTVAEAQRSAINLLNSAIKSLKFSEENGVTDNLAYAPGDPWFAVEHGEIEDFIPVESVLIEGGGMQSVRVGKTLTLTATVAPADASDPGLTWESNNPACATVEDGVVTGVSKGMAVVAATAHNGVSYSVIINITN